jgi:uncharacterized protein
VVGSPFHAGEKAAQAQLGLKERMEKFGSRAIRDFMPDQHRDFFAGLRFAFAATLDADDWPVATALSGAPGFISSPDPHTLEIDAPRDAQDGVTRTLVPGAKLGLLGIDLATRRRNRANGHIARADAEGFAVAIEQSFGNCPQYIQARDIVWVGARETGPREEFAGLDAEAHLTIRAADTFFVASSSGGRADSATGIDISHRGGRPGFVRVEAGVLTVPDFAGNRYFNTLGNFMINPRAGLLFVDFASGDLLHLSGKVEILWQGEEAQRVRGAERLWRLTVSQGWRRRGVLPLRWAFRDYAPTTEETGVWPRVD